MAPQAAVVSYRLGGNDGVSVEARKWAWALGELGFAVRRVAGAIEDDGGPTTSSSPGLTIDPAPAPSIRGCSADAIDGADLVIVDNVCSLPLNLEAARAVARASHEHPAGASCSGTTICRGSAATSLISEASSRRASTARCT